MIFSRSIAVLAITACMIASADAKSQKINVRSGAKTHIWTQAIYTISSCYMAPFPKVSFRQPVHGNLTFKRRKIRVPTGQKCAGKTLNGIVISYKSKSGYRGKDKARAYFSFPAYPGEHVMRTHNVNFVFNIK